MVKFHSASTPHTSIQRTPTHLNQKPSGSWSPLDPANAFGEISHWKHTSTCWGCPQKSIHTYGTAIFRDHVQRHRLRPLPPVNLAAPHGRRDRALVSFQVNGLDMQGATHHEAVSALRNAGSCIRMTVLRDRLPPPEVNFSGGPRDERDATGQQLSNPEGQTASMESREGCLSQSTVAVVCNGNDVSGFLK